MTKILKIIQEDDFYIIYVKLKVIEDKFPFVKI